MMSRELGANPRVTRAVARATQVRRCRRAASARSAGSEDSSSRNCRGWVRARAGCRPSWACHVPASRCVWNDLLDARPPSLGSWRGADGSSEVDCSCKRLEGGRFCACMLHGRSFGSRRRSLGVWRCVCCTDAGRDSARSSAAVGGCPRSKLWIFIEAQDPREVSCFSKENKDE